MSGLLSARKGRAGQEVEWEAGLKESIFFRSRERFLCAEDYLCLDAHGRR